MKKTSTGETIKKYAVRGVAGGLALALLYGISSCTLDKVEKGNLQENLKQQQDGATFELISPNAVYMTIYMVVNDDDDFVESEFTDAYIFDFESETVLAGKDPENNKAPSHLLSFATFANPGMIAKVTRNGCAIAKKMSSYSESSLFQSEEREALKARASNFAARYCPQ